MANVSKVVTSDGTTLLDLTEDTVAADNLILGVTAHDSDGNSIVGTLSNATTTSAGLMSPDDKTKLDATNIAFCTCSTAAATAAKVVTIDSANNKFALVKGAIIGVKFTYTNTASSVTLNVGSTGAKQIWYNTAAYTGSSNSVCGYAARYIFYMYDGTYWVWLSYGQDANSTYSNASLGQGYGTCATAEATAAKVVTLGSYSLTTGGIVAVKFTYAVPANATMNINSKGAKNIFHNGAAITANVIKAGEIATFIYDGTQYHLITINRIFSGSYNDLTNKPTIPTKVSELTNDSGYTTNTGTVTSVAVKMNNSVKGTVTSSGTIDLGTVITSHQDISGKLDKTGGTLTGRLSVSTEAITLATGKITGLTAGTTQIFKDGIAISNPATANDLGFIRVTGTGESDTVMEIATGDDGGVGETIVFRGYNTANNATYTATVPKKTGTIALTSDIPTATGSPSGTTSVLTSVKSAGAAPTLGTAIAADDITAWSAGSTPTLGTAIAADDITKWSAGTLPALGTEIPADDITSWSAGSGSFSVACTTDTIAGAGQLTFTHTHVAPSLGYTAKSIPNVTGVGTLPTLEYTARSIPNVTSVGSAPSLTYSAVSIPNVTSAGSMPTFNSGNVSSTSHTHSI